MKIPLMRLDDVDGLLENIKMDLQNKVSIHDLYIQLKSKAQVEKVKSIEKTVIQINEYISTLPQIFADKHENDQAQKLL
jgi:hypothetical protein